MRPNFLILVTDEMQSASLGCNGNPDVQTPNLDQLAKGGITFTHTYCANPMCQPSRATMITGLTPRGHGCLVNGNLLPEHVPTITQALADVGYRTHAVGKLHLQPFNGWQTQQDLGRGAPLLPLLSWEDQTLWNEGRITRLPCPYYGFQSADYVGGHVDYCFGTYANWLRENYPGTHELYAKENAYHVVEATRSCWRMPIPEELHYNHWIADRGIAFLDTLQPGENFFLVCSFPDPHWPFAACQPYSEMYDPKQLEINPTWDLAEDPCPHLAQRRRRWQEAWHMEDFDEPTLREIVAQTYGMITHVDHSVGRILAHLKAKGLEESAVVVFTSDHGDYLGSHHLLHKESWPWEELIRVPFIWRVPGGHAFAAGCGQVASMLDLAPTVLDYAGVDQEVLDMSGWGRATRRGLPGRSLKPLLDRGQSLEERPAIVEYDASWLDGPLYRTRSLIEGRLKLTVFPHVGEGILIDLDRDPEERHNLWHQTEYATVRVHLMERLLEELIWTDRMDTRCVAGA